MKKKVKMWLCLMTLMSTMLGTGMVVLADCNESGHEFYVMQETVTGQSVVNTHTHYDSNRDQLYNCSLIKQNVTVLKKCRNCGYTFSEFTERLIHKAN